MGCVDITTKPVWTYSPKAEKLEIIPFPIKKIDRFVADNVLIVPLKRQDVLFILMDLFCRNFYGGRSSKTMKKLPKSLEMALYFGEF